MTKIETIDFVYGVLEGTPLPERDRLRLAREIDEHYEPRPIASPAPVPPEVEQAQAEIAGLPQGITSDEGQSGYTENEVLELLDQEQERTLKAVYRRMRKDFIYDASETRALGRAVRKSLAKVSKKQALTIRPVKADETEVSHA